MASEIFENIWKFMKENNFQLINEINNDFICNICNKLMVKACNTPCGCKYCSDCIEIYLDGKNKFCPGKSKICKLVMINYVNDVSINYVTNIKILELVVKCPLNNCEFTNELSSLESHMRICDKNSTSCPYFEMGCKNDEVINDEMKNHLCNEIYCHTKLLLDFISNLRNEIASMKNDIVELKSENQYLNKELEKIKFESKNSRMKNEEFERKIKNNVSEIEELNKEMVYLKNENRSLMDKLENIEKSRINEEVIERMQRKSEQQTREIDEMKEKCQQTENKEIEMRKIIDEIFDKNADLMKKSNIDYNEKINNLQIKIIEMERYKEVNILEFEWKIDNVIPRDFESKRIYSEPFYSFHGGYKMCLSVNCFPFVIYVTFHLMRGEFDDDLLWPFKYAITIDVINQMNGTVYTNRMIKECGYSCNVNWDKPKEERNKGINFQEISQPKKIFLNNEMLVKCKIKMEQQF